MKRTVLILAAICYSALGFSQGFNQGTIVAGFNMGVPHLYRGIVKIGTGSNVFKSKFNDRIEVSEVTGMFPILFRAEYGINKYFGLGISGGTWNIRFDVKDNYNILHAGQVTGTDEIDTYKFKITSTSLGIRPNIHIPIDNNEIDIFIGMGIGITKNTLNIDFSSTDVNKVFPNLDYDLSLPGGVYFAPTIGYRQYFNNLFGYSAELGYEKGAIIQAGLVLRLNNKPKENKKKVEE
ncbi:MAG: hypothetical protein ACK50A_01650 [Sphingobacteriaceae bacterium]|jgi:hypothetical protein